MKFWPKNPFLGKFGAKSQTRKLAHIVSWGCWFLFWHYFTEFPTINLFLGKFGLKKSKLSILLQNWHTWYLADVDSESRLRFLKFLPQHSFLGKFGLKESKFFVSPENWYLWYLGRVDSKSGVIFLKFRPQNPFWESLVQESIQRFFLFA